MNTLPLLIRISKMMCQSEFCIFEKSKYGLRRVLVMYIVRRFRDKYLHKKVYK